MSRNNGTPSYSQRRADQRADRMEQQDWKLSQQADQVRWNTPDMVRKEEDRLSKEFDNMVKQETARTHAEVAEVLSEPVTQYVGGVDGPITLTHWKTPALGDIGKDDAPSGPLMSLSSDNVQSYVDAVKKQNPAELVTPAGVQWVEDARTAETEVMERYRFLPLLLDNRRAAQLFGSIGLTRTETEEDKLDGGTGQVIKRKRHTVHVPTLLGAEVTPDGLELTYAHREGDSVSTWTPKVAALADVFKQAKVNASNLKVKGDKEGNIVLDFDDAPSGFPSAIGPAAPAAAAPATIREAADRYSKARWVLGVDRRGRDVSFPCEHFQHILVTGETGGGKSVWVRTQVEAMRAGDQYGAGSWTVYILDGKNSDYVSMRDLPNVGMVAPRSDPDMCVWMIHTVRREMDRRVEEAARKKAAGDTRAYEFPPILLLIDEWGLTATDLRQKYGKKVEAVFADIDAILRLGREPRVHVALASQNIRKTGDASVPGSWFTNFKLIVSLGNPDEMTIQSAFPDSLRGRAAELGHRIRGLRGRGMFADVEHNRVSEFQSYYGWSPGTTSLDPNASKSVSPPNEQVRRSWEQWEPISSSVPVLSPRVGIAARGPEWRTDIDTIFATPAVALTNRDGDPIPETQKFDPMRVDWIGAEQSDDEGPSIALVGFDDPAPTPSTPKTATPKTEGVTQTETPSDNSDSGSTPSLDDILADPSHPKRGEIIAHLRAQGISVPGLTDDTDDSAAVDSTEPARESGSALDAVREMGYDPDDPDVQLQVMETAIGRGLTVPEADLARVRAEVEAKRAAEKAALDDITRGPYAPDDNDGDDDTPLVEEVQKKADRASVIARAKSLGLNINEGDKK